MKKLFTLLLLSTFLMIGTGSAWAATATTVYYAIPSNVVGSYTVKLNVNFTGNSSDWKAYVMTDTKKTYNSKKVYSCTFTDKYDGLGCMQFQLYDGETWESQEYAIGSDAGGGNSNLSWTTPGTYNNKMFTYGGSGFHSYYVIEGSWDSYTPHILFDQDLTVTSLSALTDYYFCFKYLKSDGTEDTYKNSGFATYNFSNWEFTTSGNNCHFHTGSAGSYTISHTFNASNNPVVSLTYPACKVISFDNSQNWSSVHLYSWTGEGGSKVEQLGDYPGNYAINYPYQVAFPTDNVPDKIIWSDNHDNKEWAKTADLDFEDNAVYKYDGLKKHTLTINSTYGWASMYLDYAVKIPDGVSVYTAASATNDWVTLSEVSDIIPANTGVIVKGSTADYQVCVESPAAITPNLFEGVLTNTTVAASSVYVLGKYTTSSQCVFSLYSGTTLEANKIYISTSSIPSPAPSIRFVIEGENNATGVENIETSENVVKFFENGQLYILREGVVYDVTGRQVK